jgi:hypothetical protein
MLPSKTILLPHLIFVIVLIVPPSFFLLFLSFHIWGKPIVPLLRIALKLSLEDRLVCSLRASTRVPFREDAPDMVRYLSMQRKSIGIFCHFTQEYVASPG